MRNFKGTFEARKRSFISAFSTYPQQHYQQLLTLASPEEHQV